jgi:DNA-binding transcriptional ArsR family regulator
VVREIKGAYWAFDPFFRTWGIPMITTGKNGSRFMTPKATTTTRKTKAQIEDVRRLKVHRAAIFLKQISDPTRLQVIRILADGEKHVGALCEEFNVSQPAVSHHLALLRHGGVIIPRRQGKNSFYALTEMGEVLAEVIKAVIR